MQIGGSHRRQPFALSVTRNDEHIQWAPASLFIKLTMSITLSWRSSCKLRQLVRRSSTWQMNLSRWPWGCRSPIVLQLCVISSIQQLYTQLYWLLTLSCKEQCAALFAVSFENELPCFVSRDVKGITLRQRIDHGLEEHYWGPGCVASHRLNCHCSKRQEERVQVNLYSVNLLNWVLHPLPARACFAWL